MSDDPYALFTEWMAEAARSEPNDPNAMALATVDETGLPNVRMVLLKGADENGFVFYTNTESNKGRELLGQRKAAIVLHWKSLRRQVRARAEHQHELRAGAIELLPSVRPGLDRGDARIASRGQAAPDARCHRGHQLRAPVPDGLTRPRYSRRCPGRRR